MKKGARWEILIGCFCFTILIIVLAINSHHSISHDKDVMAVSSASCESTGNIDSFAESDLSEDSFKFSQQLGSGINIGNSLDAYDKSANAEKVNSITDYEMLWNNPVITQDLMKLIKETGFDTVRIPVTWDNHLSGDNTIDPAWLARVKQVVDYAYACDLYVIIDIHHDRWVSPTYARKGHVTVMTQSIWTQIADYFRDYDNHLIFEGFNEPRLQDTDYEWTGTQEGYDMVNKIMNCFVKTVRATGGGNSTRYLMIDAYASGDDPVQLNALEIPQDNYLLLSVHAYEPYQFVQDKEGTTHWSSENAEDTGELDEIFAGLQNVSRSFEIPIVITEFGALDKGNEKDREDWCRYYVRKARAAGFSYIWWDNNYPAAPKECFSILDRKNNKVAYPELADILTGKN